MPERITSRANARVRMLRSALLGSSGDTAGIEGFHLLREAIASGLPIHSVFLREDQAGVAAQLPADVAAVTVTLSTEVFRSAASTEHAQGVAAIVQKPVDSYAPRESDLLLVADGLQDPGNLGTLIRSAEAFGAAAVALGPNTVDPWNGKSLRAAAGAAFRLPLPRWSATLYAAWRASGGRIFAATARDGAAAHLSNLRGTIALIVGNEASGVSEEMLAVADERITLVTPGPTESLNAAVAGSLLLYEAAQQRQRG